MRLFGSLGARIYGVATLALTMALLLGGLLLQGSYRARDALDWVRQSRQVLTALYSLEIGLGEAESSVRGYLLSHDPSYLATFDANLTRAAGLAAGLPRLVEDNPVQSVPARQVAELARRKIDFMRRSAALARSRGGYLVPDPKLARQARALMVGISSRVEMMLQHEQRLLAARTAAADTQIERTRNLLLYGCPVLALLILCVAWQIRSSISRPLGDLLDAVNRFGAGQRSARVAVPGSSIEFARLARAYNGMADHLVAAMEQQGRAEEQLARANAELVERSADLEARQHSVALLSEMSHRMQAIQSEGELAAVLDCFLPQVLPGLAGALYVHNHSRNMLMRMSLWGAPQASPEMFAPSECWGLRRGKPHAVDRPGADLICAHAAAPIETERLCQPMLAGGAVLGLLYLEGAITGEATFRLNMLVENVALALVNENLRSRLREQSIRDPLTKLFNRRSMEESLTLETARASRNQTDLSVVMCDIDHFKRFNDGYGHPAGDMLIAAVAAQIQSHFRHGDIVCRYGGEEFTVIAPGASPALIYSRVEALRLAVREMRIDHHGQRLGPVTMSFGIDTWTAGDKRNPDMLVGEADRALFRAKRLGRDRIEVAQPGALPEAAE